MKAFLITYSFANDETKISFSKDFETADGLTKLDILKDVIGDLNNFYDEALNQYSKNYGRNPIAKG